MLPPISVDLIAECSEEQAFGLFDWDHHQVLVNGQPAIILTYHWYALEIDEPNLLAVVFEHAMKHPKAPAEIQAIVDSLEFTPPS